MSNLFELPIETLLTILQCLDSFLGLCVGDRGAAQVLAG